MCSDDYPDCDCSFHDYDERGCLCYDKEKEDPYLGEMPIDWPICPNSEQVVDCQDELKCCAKSLFGDGTCNNDPDVCDVSCFNDGEGADCATVGMLIITVNTHNK